MLENIIFELNCLVDYGCYYLAKQVDLSDIGKVYSDEQIREYAKNNYYIDDIFTSSEIEDHVRNNYGIGDLWDKWEIRDYLSNTYDIDDFVDWV